MVLFYPVIDKTMWESLQHGERGSLWSAIPRTEDLVSLLTPETRSEGGVDSDYGSLRSESQRMDKSIHVGARRRGVED
jgi:hypothetical protein